MSQRCWHRGGYAYAHFVTERLERKQQVFVHGAVLLIALVVLPITPNATWKPAGGGDPLFGITTLLAVSVGIPYLALAASAPLLQRWFVAIHPERSPYRLYALSNLGSLLGLWLYPFLLEPFFSLEMQTKIWSAFFALYVVVSGGCAWALTRAQDDAAEPSTEPRSQDIFGCSFPVNFMSTSWKIYSVFVGGVCFEHVGFEEPTSSVANR